MDLYRELERGLRTYPERLPIDEFLPPPERIPSALPEAPRFEASPPSPPGRPPHPLPTASPSGEPAPRRTGNEQLDREVREYLEHQKARGRHDPGEWVQENESAARPGPVEPSPGSED